MKMKVAKKKNRRIGLLAGLLLVGNPVLAEEAFLHMSLDGDRISLAARNVPAQDVLDELAVLYSIDVVQQSPLDRMVTLEFERQALAYAVRNLLENDSYQLFEPRGETGLDPDGSGASGILWIFSEGTSVASLATSFHQSVLLKGDVRARKEAIKALRKLGSPEAVSALSLALADNDEEVRIAAIRALSRIGGDDALAAINSAALDEDPWIRSEAANALAQAGGSSATQYLDLAAQDEDPMVREAVVEALVDEHGVQAIGALTSALSDPDPNVRLMAVDALEEIGGHAAYDALLQVSDDPDPAVRDAVKESLQLLRQQ